MKIFKNKKIKYILCSSLALLLILGGISLAYISNSTGPLTNTFKVGEVTTEIEEEEPKIDKTVINKAPKVVNIGENDCLVRVRVTVSPEEISEFLDELSQNDSTTGIIYSKNWEYNNKDGFWYYLGVVPSVDANQTPNSTTPLFDKIVGLTDENGKIIDKFKNLNDFSITLYQESVQAIVYNENGDVVGNAWGSNKQYDKEEAKKIWAAYDSKTNN